MPTTTDTRDLDEFMAQPVEKPPERPRRLKKYRKYPRPPELTLEQKRDLLEIQGGV